MKQHTGPRQKRIENARKIKNAGKNLIVKGHLAVLGRKPTALDLWDTSVCVYLQRSFRVSWQSLLSSLADTLTVALVSDIRSNGARMASKWLKATDRVQVYTFRTGVGLLRSDIPYLMYEGHHN